MRGEETVEAAIHEGDEIRGDTSKFVSAVYLRETGNVG
jgi:hypothetical protein